LVICPAIWVALAEFDGDRLESRLLVINPDLEEDDWVFCEVVFLLPNPLELSCVASAELSKTSSSVVLDGGLCAKYVCLGTW
jgi:hypothetical protein